MFLSRSFVGRLSLWALAGLGTLALTRPARADFIVTWSGSGTSQTGVAIQASADFSFNSGTKTLTITLTNTGTVSTTDPGSTLTGLYFNLGTALTPVSAALGGTSFLVDGPADKFGATHVGQGWAYGDSGVVPPSGDGLASANTGIISTGYGSFPTGNGNFITTPAPVMLDGVGWGIIPASNGTTGLSGANNNPVINDQVVFTLTSPTDLSASAITGVEFAYGTGDGEGGFTGHPTPEPASITLFGVGIVGTGLIGVYRRARAQWRAKC
jgi:hypothetical protein